MTLGPDGRAPRLVFVVTEDWYFVSHRLPLAIAARDAGYEVIVASRFDAHRDQLVAAGIDTRPIKLRRRGRSVLHEVAAVADLRRLYRDVQPAIVHHVALKPVVFGSLATIGLHRVAVVNAIAGLGFLYTSRRLLPRLLRAGVSRLLRLALRRPRGVVIVQNEEDRAVLLGRGLAEPSRIRLMRGAGVELNVFQATPEPGGTPIVAFAGRLLWSKGVDDFVAAARALRQRQAVARFALVGEPDLDNPDHVPPATLRAWEADGVVELWGRRDDMPSVLAAVHVVCLPSVYGEGVPKILLEAAAAGRPVVTTDWPGCRDAVRDGETGLLVPPRQPDLLAAALERLLMDPGLRRSMGQAARRLAEREFDVKSIIAATLAIYDELTT